MKKKIFATALLVTLLIGVTPVYAASTPADLIPVENDADDSNNFPSGTACIEPRSSLTQKRSLNNFCTSINLPEGSLTIYVCDPNYSGLLTCVDLYSTNSNGWCKNEIMDRLCGVTVLPGDTLDSIAQKYETTVENLLELNPRIDNPNKIFVGEKIQISKVVYSSLAETHFTAELPTKPTKAPAKAVAESKAKLTESAESTETEPESTEY